MSTISQKKKMIQNESDIQDNSNKIFNIQKQIYNIQPNDFLKNNQQIYLLQNYEIYRNYDYNPAYYEIIDIQLPFSNKNLFLNSKVFFNFSDSKVTANYFFNPDLTQISIIFYKPYTSITYCDAILFLKSYFN